MSLHGAIDDASGQVMGIYFRMEEDTIGYMQMLMQMLVNYGVPCGLYSDRHTIFFSPKMDKLRMVREQTEIPWYSFSSSAICSQLAP